MNTREFISIFTSPPVALWFLNVIWFAVLAAPISWLWNVSVAPLLTLPTLSYGRALGLLLLWLCVWLAHVGMKWSIRSEAQQPERPSRGGRTHD